MSFTLIEQATPRLHRSELAVPGSAPGMFEKAATSKADVVFLDLEDAVAPDAKVAARQNILAALETGFGYREAVVRINSLNTPWGLDDLKTFANSKADAIEIGRAHV